MRRTHNKTFGPANVTTTISEAWAPASGRRVRCMGGAFTLTGAADTTFHLVDGTAAASGTLVTFALDSGGNAVDLDFGEVGAYCSAVDTKLGIKANAGNGTVVATLVGREEGF